MHESSEKQLSVSGHGFVSSRVSIAATIAINLALAAVYFIAAKFGLTMAFSAEQVTVVWPPTGISLAAVLLLGYRVWPGIALGAFLANITSHEPIATAFGIAIGNTLEAVAAALLLHRFIKFDNALGRLQDVLGLLIFSVIIGCMISASIGVISLCLGGVQPWTAYRSLWVLWWMGDATGALIIAPVLLTWSRGPYTFSQLRRQPVEALALAGGLTLACVGIFINSTLMSTNDRVFVYLIFPFIMWAALRFGQRGTTLVTLVISGTAVGASIIGHGPFAAVPVEEGLMSLQIFMMVTTATGLLLSAAIAERKQAEDALKEAARRKDEFLATLAHELRNPLAPLSNALYVLQSPGADARQRDEAHSVMHRQLQHMIRLVDDLLDVSRISHGKVELRKETLSLTQVINTAIETVKPFIEANKHNLSIHFPQQPLWLNADPTRLSQVFANLLSNAAKYTPAGGTISVDVTTQADTALVSIRDTGIGIPATMLPKIFELFTQVDNSIERTQGGLGIGLTLVQSLVEMHGGSVEARSLGVHQGSEFIVRLPLAPSPPLSPEVTASPPHKTIAAALATSHPTAPASENEKPHKLRILIVDDNEALTQTLGLMVELMGHEIRLAHNGTEALAIAPSFMPDAILLDIGLSGMNGYDVCQQLRAEPALKHCIFIAQTGWGQSEHRQRSKEAGFDYHLVKPVRLDTLEQIFSSLDPQ